MATTIKPCRCKHAAQDELYGSGKRLHNKAVKGPRCTVCGDQKSPDSEPEKEKAPAK